MKPSLLPTLSIVLLCFVSTHLRASDGGSATGTAKGQSAIFTFKIAADLYLMVTPQLTPAGQLLGGGKFRVWVGRSDGVPLPNAQVTITITDSNNLLTDGTATFPTITLHTDADGFAEINLTPNNNNSGGGSVG